MGSWVSSIIATLDKKLVLAYLRTVRSESRNRAEITVVTSLIGRIESGDFDG